MKKQSLIGKVFGRLTVVGKHGIDKHGKVVWSCLCSCGKPTAVSAGSLSRGLTKSCGCLFRESLIKRNKLELAGKVFGRLTAIKEDGRNGNNFIWLCQCECGKETHAKASSLKRGLTRSCGCLKSETTSKRFRKDLSGQRFGRLIALSDIGSNAHNSRIWLCKCDCGKEMKVASSDLRGGHTKSCGCYNLDKIIERNTTHGGCYTRLHKIWSNMTSRCYIPSSTRFADYGGRGITVHDEWKKDFSIFRTWAYANGYADNLTIERKDVNGHYNPGNCKWIPNSEQSRNTRANVIITLEHKTKLLADWRREYHISRCAYDYRIHRGMTPTEAVKFLIDNPTSHSKIKREAA